ncbi:MAG: general secretion pathway protein GspB [Pseudomonadales bacterium]|nr:general secretion pathway protein GspB [Pseudomonadales bacterium]
MSLILEALRKSEEENQPTSQHTAEPSPALYSSNAAHKAAPFTSTFLAIGLAISLSLLLAAGIWFNATLPPSQHPLPQPEGALIHSEVENLKIAINIVKSDDYTKHLESSLSYKTALKQKENDTKPQLSPVIKSSRPASTQASPQNKRIRATDVRMAPVSLPLHLSDFPHISEISAQIKEQLPILSYESHWYDKKAENRTVIINSQNLREGMRIDRNLTLHAIMKNGCVLNYKGELFHMVMLKSWPEIN